MPYTWSSNLRPVFTFIDGQILGINELKSQFCNQGKPHVVVMGSLVYTRTSHHIGCKKSQWVWMALYASQNDTQSALHRTSIHLDL